MCKKHKIRQKVFNSREKLIIPDSIFVKILRAHLRNVSSMFSPLKALVSRNISSAMWDIIPQSTPPFFPVITLVYVKKLHRVHIIDQTQQAVLCEAVLCEAVLCVVLNEAFTQMHTDHINGHFLGISRLLCCRKIHLFITWGQSQRALHSDCCKQIYTDWSLNDFSLLQEIVTCPPLNHWQHYSFCLWLCSNAYTCAVENQSQWRFLVQIFDKLQSMHCLWHLIWWSSQVLQ